MWLRCAAQREVATATRARREKGEAERRWRRSLVEMESRSHGGGFVAAASEGERLRRPLELQAFARKRKIGGQLAATRDGSAVCWPRSKLETEVGGAREQDGGL